LSDDLKRKSAALIVADEFEDLELFHPLYRLQEEGISTIVIGLTKEPIKAKKRYSIMPNASIDEVNAENFDFLVVPGGKSPEKLRLNTKILRFVKDFDLQAKPIGAICHAGSVSVRRDCKESNAYLCFENKRRDDQL
jgi:protease I